MSLTVDNNDQALCFMSSLLQNVSHSGTSDLSFYIFRPLGKVFNVIWRSHMWFAHISKHIGKPCLPVKYHTSSIQICILMVFSPLSKAKQSWHFLSYHIWLLPFFFLLIGICSTPTRVPSIHQRNPLITPFYLIQKFVLRNFHGCGGWNVSSGCILFFFQAVQWYSPYCLQRSMMLQVCISSFWERLSH